MHGNLGPVEVSKGSSFDLFGHMTAKENVMFGPIELLKISKREAEVHARELLRKVGLADKMDNYPSQLSDHDRRHR